MDTRSAGSSGRSGRTRRTAASGRPDPAGPSALPRPEPAPPPAASPPLVGLPFERDSYAATAFADVIDRAVHAATAQWTGGVSPAALAEAFMDWALHLAASPGKRLLLAEKAVKKSARLAAYAWRRAAEPGADCARCIEPLVQDRRFEGEAWRQWPFDLLHQGFLLNQQWWHNAMTGVRGVTARHENLVQFVVRQMLDVVSPANFPWSHPEVLARTAGEGGMNLLRGGQHALEDAQRAGSGAPPVGADAFHPGREVACTPGRVVLRNRLIELIQYEPVTPKVHPEPVLVVPAWIMKYYILDLSPHNSLVRHLLQRGFTVFMVSWKNPLPEDRDLGMDDYRRLGVMAALEAVAAIVPGARVHAAGYCLGGTLLAIAAAAMARERDERLATLTLLAAQIDFTEAGELTLFIGESQLAFLEDMMWEQGFLDSTQMAGAFRTLRSNDLVWSRLVRDYLLGERTPMTDLMAWNADATRMPYRMHTEYLRQLFLHNDLAEGRLQVDGRPVAPGAITVPLFALGTEHDHVAPWRSVFKVHRLSSSPVTFVLATGGHNAGVIAPAGEADRPRRGFRMQTHAHESPPPDPDTWPGQARASAGSWWPAWTEWLSAHSTPPALPPRMGAPEQGLPPLMDAPGSYVLQR